MNRHWSSVVPASLPLGSPAFALYVMPAGAFTCHQYWRHARAAGFELALSTARQGLRPLVKLALVELEKRARHESDLYIPHVPTCLIPAIASIIETHRRQIRVDDKGYKLLATEILGFLHGVDDTTCNGSMDAEVRERITLLMTRIDARFALTADDVAHARMTAQVPPPSSVG